MALHFKRLALTAYFRSYILFDLLGRPSDMTSWDHSLYTCRPYVQNLVKQNKFLSGNNLRYCGSGRGDH